MEQRAERLPDPPDRHPYLRADTPTAAGTVLRLPRPSEIVAMVEPATEAAQAAKAAQDDNDAGAFLDAQDALVRASGYIIMRCWADPVWELQARTLYDAMAFTRSPAGGRSAAGRFAADELYDSGWPEADIIRVGMELYRRSVEVLQGMPSDVEVREAEATFRG